MLNRYLTAFGLILLLAAPLGLAQDEQEAAADEGPAQGWGVFASYIEGDVLSKIEQDGFRAEMDDSFGIGALFYRDLSDSVRFESRLAFLPTTVLNTENGEVDANLFYFDFSIMPNFNIGERTMIGIPLGLGWGVLMEDEDFIEQLDNRSIGLGQNGGSGMIYFIGIHFNAQVGARWEFFADVRARRFHRLVNVEERTVKPFELSVGFTKRF